MLRCWFWKNPNSKAFAHTKTFQNFGTTCVLLFVAKASQAKSSTNLANLVIVV
jgi:hypothetical protein